MLAIVLLILVSALSLAAGTFLIVALRRLRSRFRRVESEHFNTRLLIENLSEGIYRASMDGVLLSASPSLVWLSGYETQAEMMADMGGKPLDWYVEPGRGDKFRVMLETDGRVKNFVSEVHRRRSGERLWISESARIVRDHDGKRLYYDGSVRDITETMRRLNLEKRFQTLISSLPGGLFQLELDAGVFRLDYVSEGFLRISGMTEHHLKADPAAFLKLVHADDLAGYNKALRQSYSGMEPWDHEFRVRTPAGDEKWLRIIATPTRGTTGAVVWHGHVADVSVRKLQKMEIENLAFIDPLTLLPNRRKLRALLDDAVGTAPLATKSALIYIDLDDFKTLNDTLGHTAGDNYLIEVAARLTRCLRPTDAAARIGGDEFVAFLANVGTDRAIATAAAISAADRIRSALQLPFIHEGVPHKSSASVGVVICEGSECGADELMKHADTAMYRAKGAGGDAIALYDGHAPASPEILRAAERRRSVRLRA